MTNTSAPVARLLNRQGAISGLVHGNVIPMGWDGHKLLWEWDREICPMDNPRLVHGKRPMGWDEMEQA